MKKESAIKKLKQAGISVRDGKIAKADVKRVRAILSARASVSIAGIWSWPTSTDDVNKTIEILGKLKSNPTSKQLYEKLFEKADGDSIADKYDSLGATEEYYNWLVDKLIDVIEGNGDGTQDRDDLFKSGLKKLQTGTEAAKKETLHGFYKIVDVSKANKVTSGNAKMLQDKDRCISLGKDGHFRNSDGNVNFAWIPMDGMTVKDIETKYGLKKY